MNMLPFKKIFIAASIAGAIMASPVSNAAAVINTAFNPGINTVQDSDADRLMRNGAAVTSGSFQVGDVFQSILRFDTVNSTAINSAVGTLNYGLWAYSAVSIESLTAIDTNGDLVNDAYSVSFGASGLLSDPGVMIELYEANSSANFLSQTVATGINNVRSLTQIATFGKVEADDFWTATIPFLIQNLVTPLGSGQAPSGVLGLSLLSNAGALPIETNGITSGATGTQHDIVGDASAFPRETGVNSGWLASTNTNVSFNVVPEPDSLALLGLGALLLSASAKRRQNA